jgi:hypothetical protein
MQQSNYCECEGNKGQRRPEDDISRYILFTFITITIADTTITVIAITTKFKY